MANVPVHVVVPVWGAAYTQGFIDVGMPALLASQNLPSLLRSDGHLCHIVTTAVDRASIEASDVFKALAQIIDVRFDDIGADPAASQHRHHWQSYCNRVGIQVADERQAAMIFLNPDVVFADGAIKSLVNLLNQGKRAIQVLAVRLVKEIAIPALINGHRSSDGTRLAISPRDLMRMAIGNLHPLTLMHMYDRPELDLQPSNLYWRAGDQGLVCRCFHLHPMLIYPQIRNAPFSTTIDDDYLRAACPDPNDEYIVSESDECCAVELSGMERAGPGLPRGTVNDSVARWAANSAKPEHLENFVRRIFLRASDTDTGQWQAACSRSDEAVHDIMSKVLDLKHQGGV